METNLKTVRGVRVVQALNEDSTYPGLYTNIQRAFPHTQKRQHATGPIAITRMEYLPYAQNGVLQVNAEVRSDGTAYTPVVQFTQVQFEPNDTPENVTFKGADDNDYHIQPVQLPTTNVKVRCNCLDFYYRFAAWNATDKSLYGPAFPPYQRKTTTRPEVNPDHVPGLCKHLIKVFQQTEQEGLTRR